MKPGQPTKYGEDAQSKAWEYLENHAEYGDPVPSVVGMACHLGVCEKTLYNWAEANDEFLQTLTMCKLWQHRKLLAGGLKNDLNAGITKLMLYNHGYSEKHQQEIVQPEGVSFNMNFGDGS